MQKFQLKEEKKLQIRPYIIILNVYVHKSLLIWNKYYNFIGQYCSNV